MKHLMWLAVDSAALDRVGEQPAAPANVSLGSLCKPEETGWQYAIASVPVFH